MVLDRYFVLRAPGRHQPCQDILEPELLLLPQLLCLSLDFVGHVMFTRVPV